MVYWPNLTAERFGAKICGLPCIAIFASNFFSNVERHVCLNYSKWYKRYITNCWKDLAAQVMACLFILYIVSKFGRQWFASFQSEIVNMLSMKIDGNSVLVIFAICFLAQMVLWTISPWTCPPPETQDIELEIATVNNSCNTENVISNDSPFVHIGRNYSSRLDVEAARTSNIIGLVHLISFAPCFISWAHVVKCFQQHSPEDISLKCSTTIQIFFYLRELVAIPCFLFDPIFLVYQNPEIRKALWERVLFCVHVSFAGRSSHLSQTVSSVAVQTVDIQLSESRMEST